MKPKRLRRFVSLLPEDDAETLRIAALENRDVAEVRRLIFKLGLKAYRVKKSLLCDYRNCTRLGCCEREGAVRGQVVSFHRRR
jgi:hypothetical protein